MRSSCWRLLILAAVAVPRASVWGAMQVGGIPTALDLESPLQGVVLDESTFEPVPAATIVILGADMSTESDAYGLFAFRNPPIGQVRVRVTAPNRITMVEEVEIREGAIVHLQFQIPSLDAVLAELLVTGSASPGESAGASMTAADLVARQVPGLLFSAGMVGDGARGVRLRGINTFTQSADPHLFVDGVRVTGTRTIYDALTQIPAEDVERIEVLRGPAAAFLHQFAANGAIHVFTKSGRSASPD